MSQPLFNGSAINADTSWCAIMYCAIKNKLPYTALESILSATTLPNTKQVPDQSIQAQNMLQLLTSWMLILEVLQ